MTPYQENPGGQPVRAASRNYINPLQKQLELANAKIAALERRMALQKGTCDTFRLDLQKSDEEAHASSARISQLEIDIASAQNAAALCENRALSLQTSLELVSVENTRLQGQLRLSGTMLEDANTKIKSLWNDTAAFEAKAVGHMKEAERYRAEAEAKATLLEAATSRAETAERLCDDARKRLSMHADQDCFGTRQIAELTEICRDRGNKLVEAEDQLKAIQAELKHLMEKDTANARKIPELTEICRERGERLAELEELLKASQAEVKQLTEDDASNTSKIEKLTEICRDRGEKLDELEELLEEKQAEIKELEETRRTLTLATGVLLTNFQNQQSAPLQSQASAVAPAPTPTLAVVEAPATLTAAETPIDSGKAAQTARRSKWAELDRELTKLTLKRQRADAAPAALTLAVSQRSQLVA